MRLQRVAKPFEDPNHIFELKHDGFRVIAYIEDGKCKLVSRNQNHFNFLFLGVALGKLPVDNAILDGEVVCLDNDGVSQFNHLISRKREPVFYAFDLLWLNGKDLRRLPLLERKQQLEKLIRKSRCREILYAHNIVGNDVGFFEEICARDLERIIAKRKRGVYRDDGKDWLKIKNPKYSRAEGRHDLLAKDEPCLFANRQDRIPEKEVLCDPGKPTVGTGP
jgi:bifunctional non-homologous end joining protein LigD